MLLLPERRDRIPEDDLVHFLAMRGKENVSGEWTLAGRAENLNRLHRMVGTATNGAGIPFEFLQWAERARQNHPHDLAVAPPPERRVYRATCANSDRLLAISLFTFLKCTL